MNKNRLMYKTSSYTSSFIVFSLFSFFLFDSINVYFYFLFFVLRIYCKIIILFKHEIFAIDYDISSSVIETKIPSLQKQTFLFSEEETNKRKCFTSRTAKNKKFLKVEMISTDKADLLELSLNHLQHSLHILYHEAV